VQARHVEGLDAIIRQLGRQCPCVGVCGIDMLQFLDVHNGAKIQRIKKRRCVILIFSSADYMDNTDSFFIDLKIGN
jgi:hypothetical protein